MAATALFCQFFGDTVLAGDSPADEQTVADKALTASSLLYSQWCLAAWTAALFHDTAYPLQELTRLWYLAVPHPGAAPAGIYYADELRRLLHAMAQHVGGRLRRAAARAVGDLVLRLLPRPGSLGAADDLVARLQTELEDLGLASRLVCPDLLRELLEPAQGDDRERPFRLTNHGVLSALICVAALRGSLYLDPNPATTPEWLRWALQAMVVHDFEIDSHTRRTLQRARADRAPVVARGARRWFDFRADPVSFMLRLADKVHHWERVVRGDFELTQECKEIALEGLLWRLQRERQGIMLESGRPRWVGPPRLVLIYDEEDKLEASGWEHKKLHDDLRKYLAELPFPNDWGLPGPRPVTLRFRATLPEVVPKPDNAARNA